jgi:hypothetical protein
MDRNEPQEPSSSEGGQPGDDDHVEVLVEDLFIEEYPEAIAHERSPHERRGRLTRAVRRPFGGRAKTLLVGLFALGALAVATLVLSTRRRRASRLTRLLHELGR